MEKLGIECKQLMSKEIGERLKSNSSLFITSFNTMPVPEQEDLRRRLREINASLFVAKNRIANRTFQQMKLERLASTMKGLTAITMGGSDVIGISKTLVDFAGKHDNFKILGAYIDEQLLDRDSVKKLSTIASKEALLAQMICGFKSPIQGLVTSLSAMIKKFAIVIDKIRQTKNT